MMLIAAVCVDVVFGCFVLQDFLKYDTKDWENILSVLNIELLTVLRVL